MRVPAIAAMIALVVAFAAGWLVRDRRPISSESRNRVEFVPTGSQLIDIRVLRGTEPQQVAVVWHRQAAQYGSGFGLTVWEHRGSGWQGIYDLALPGRNEFEITDVSLRAVDLTEDGRDDLFVYDDHDGSGGGFTYRVLKSARGHLDQIESGTSTADRTAIFIAPGELISYDGVGKDPATGASIHCCPRYLLRRVRRWNGKRMVVVSRSRAERVPRGFLVRESRG